MRRRGGIALVELIAATALASTILLAISGLFKEAALDVPRATQAMRDHSDLTAILARMRRDVESGRDLPATCGGVAASESVLLIAQDAGAIRYEVGDETIVRTRLDTQGRPVKADRATTWPIPRVKLTWKLRGRGRPRAVEIHTHVRLQVGSKTLKRLENAHVFFAGIWPEARGES